MCKLEILMKYHEFVMERSPFLHLHEIDIAREGSITEWDLDEINGE